MEQQVAYGQIIKISGSTFKGQGSSTVLGELQGRWCFNFILEEIEEISKKTAGPWRIIRQIINHGDRIKALKEQELGVHDLKITWQ